MYIIFAVSVLLISTRALAVHVITAEDRLLDEIREAASRSDQLGFDAGDFLDQHGYPFENHEVTTEDGYILTLHRIPHGRNESGNSGTTKPSVLIMHGLYSSSVHFFILGPGRSLALMLVDQGYDVWLGNNRGNTYSRNHITLNPDTDAAFWDFSFHELGVYDDTAMIDHILNKTGNKRLSYIGHSQGTTQFFAMASTRPEYNRKITIMTALAPVAYAQNLSHPLVQLLKDYYIVVELVVNRLNVTEFLPHSTFVSSMGHLLCTDTSEFQELCAGLLFLIFGFDSGQLNRTILPTIYDHLPAGGSIMEPLHYLQLVRSGNYRRFDYGILRNLQIYGRLTPPDYDTSLITTPVALYYGENDWLVGLADVNRLAGELPIVAEKHLISYRNFNHLDFVFGTDAPSILYNHVIDMLTYYNNLPTTEENDSTTTPGTRTTTPSAGVLLYSLRQFVCVYIGVIVVKLLV